MVCGSAPRPLFFYACGTLLYREDSKKAKQCKVDFGRKLNGILSALKRVEASTRSTSTGIATYDLDWLSNPTSWNEVNGGALDSKDT